MSTIYGYNGKLAFIDLSSQRIEKRPINQKDLKDYIGGCGLSAKIIFDVLKEKDYKALIKNPLDPINPIVFATGPITATARPSSGRYSVSAISPLTGIWGESTSGGQFPAALKKSGFDAVIITGKARSPIYILINNGEIEIKAAYNIWGLDSYQTQKRIKEEVNDKRVKIACIGKAGENLVNYACIINDNGRAAGRTGMGAVLGSKNCKALAIIGTKNIDIKDKDNFRKYIDESKTQLGKSFSASFFEQFGTLCYMDLGQAFGDTPAYYFTETKFISSKLTGKALKDEFAVINNYCFGCAIGCGRTTYLKKDGTEIKIDGPEYETTASYGPLLGILELKPILEMNHLSNQQGVDTISAGVTIAFLIYLIENKIAIDKIKNELIDIEIEEIKWGNAKIAYKLLEKIIKREDIGNLLAKGTRRLAQELGIDSGLAAHVKGLEIPMHDPRAYLGQALTYMTSCIGASHNKGDYFNVDAEGLSFPTLKIRRSNRFEIINKEPSIIILQDIRAIDDSSISCNFVSLQFPLTIQIINAITDFNYDIHSLLECGERISNLKRLISCKLGLSRKDDYLPRIVTLPLQSGLTKGITLNLEEHLKNYYNIRKWDWETGKPMEEKLKELGIIST